jgi:glycosyltransferase involved in cell wall biosynthesis
MGARASIVIPCFNRERFIGEAIESALGQGPEIEVVAIDDGSTDGSLSVIQSFGTRIRSARSENRGVGAARNAGVALASGDFIQFLDSDDRIPPGTIAERLQAATDLGEKQVALARMAVIDEQGSRIGMIQPATKLGPLEPQDFLGAFVGAPVPFFPRTALLEAGGFDERFPNHEDHELVIRLLAAGYGFVGVSTIACEARVHGGHRLSCDWGDARFDNRLEVLEAMTRTLADAGVSAAGLAAHARLVWAAGREAARAGQRSHAEALFRMARRLAGPRAVKGRLPARIAQQVLGPYRAERLIEAAKAIGRRLGLG